MLVLEASTTWGSRETMVEVLEGIGSIAAITHLIACSQSSLDRVGDELYSVEDNKTAMGAYP